jgi:hypothetical protein
VGADLVLRARELLRRNGEGSLWHPGFWPRSAAAGFWPFVLVVVLAALGVGLGGRFQPLPPHPTSSPRERDSTASLAVPPVPAETPQPEAAPATPPDPAPVPRPEPLPAPLTLPGPEEELRQAFAALASQDLILTVRPDPAMAQLHLEVADMYARLEPSRRRQLVDQWAGVAVDRGYDRLEVVDGSGRLWARPAAVGGGLVVFGTPVAPEPR